MIFRSNTTRASADGKNPLVRALNTLRRLDRNGQEPSQHDLERLRLIELRGPEVVRRSAISTLSPH